MKHNEYKLQVQVCEYIRKQYPEILFMSDTITSIKLTPIQGYRNKQIQKDGFKTPDLIVFKPNKRFNGLFIELKIKSPYKKNGEILSDEHLKAQQETLQHLIKLGYYASFAWNFEQCKEIIDLYLSMDC